MGKFCQGLSFMADVVNKQKKGRERKYISAARLGCQVAMVGVTGLCTNQSCPGDNYGSFEPSTSPLQVTLKWLQTLSGPKMGLPLARCCWPGPTGIIQPGFWLSLCANIGFPSDIAPPLPASSGLNDRRGPAPTKKI